MVTKKKKKTVKKRKPKGKPLSEALEEKEAKRAAELAAAEEDADEDELTSEPPPAFDDEDGDDDAIVDAQFDDEEDAPEAGRAADEDGDEEDGDEEDDDEEDGDEEDGDEEDGDEEDWDDEDLAAAQMGHQRYVIAGFFGLWVIVGYIGGRTLELIWSRLAAKDWFIESLPQLAAIPHEGDLVSRESISLVVGAVIAGAIVLRYYTKADVRQWADEVAEQLTHVKWPTRKDVGNNTVVVMVASFVLTAYLTLLDRLWAFVTNLIYTSGT